VPGHTFQLYREQLVRRPLREVFRFFTEAKNLELITPDFLHFRILTPPALLRIEPGARIDYKLRLFGIPFHWCTQIETLEPERRFTDVQLAGPYASWHHLHEFRETEGGTLVIDNVEYELPLGLLGRMAHALFIRQSLERIFEHRRQRVEKLFNR
jgi:ligand-binding SRPBCC domain-containing protein